MDNFFIVQRGGNCDEFENEVSDIDTELFVAKIALELAKVAFAAAENLIEKAILWLGKIFIEDHVNDLKEDLKEANEKLDKCKEDLLKCPCGCGDLNAECDCEENIGSGSNNDDSSSNNDDSSSNNDDSSSNNDG